VRRCFAFVTLASSLKKLHGAFVALRGGKRRERSQVSPFAAARLAFSGIKAIPAGFQLFDHFSSFTREQCAENGDCFAARMG
jgi:hypothetical protein